MSLIHEDYMCPVCSNGYMVLIDQWYAVSGKKEGCLLDRHVLACPNCMEYILHVKDEEEAKLLSISVFKQIVNFQSKNNTYMDLKTS